jgi:hypothetical protein
VRVVLAELMVWSALCSFQTAVARSRTRLAASTLGVLLAPVLTIAFAAAIS